jgi:rhamnosyltransferase subunit B
LLTPTGSAGDVHPFVGIGRRLEARGHEIVLATAEPFRGLAESSGFAFHSTWPVEEYERVVREADLFHPRRSLRLVLGIVAENLRRGYELVRELYRPGETLVVGHALAFAVRVFEDRHGAPTVTLQLAPSAFRSLHEQPAMQPGRDLSRAPRWVKRSLWWLVDTLFVDRYLEPQLNALRRELGLPPVRHPFRSWIHSPRRTIGLFPDWFGRPQPDWPPQTRLAGFPLFDDGEGRTLDAELEAFLEEGAPPVAITPGSAHRHASAFIAAALEACRRLGRRALVLTGYPDQLPEPLPPHARHLRYAPFSRLFPRCAAVVHHAGIGTCAQGLAAGVPHLTMPLAFDQPDNATRLARLGVAAHLTPRRFTARRAARALARLWESPAVAAACRERREALATVDGAGRACDLIEEAGRQAGLA